MTRRPGCHPGRPAASREGARTRLSLPARASCDFLSGRVLEPQASGASADAVKRRLRLTRRGAALDGAAAEVEKLGYGEEPPPPVGIEPLVGLPEVGIEIGLARQLGRPAGQSELLGQCGIER